MSDADRVNELEAELEKLKASSGTSAQAADQGDSTRATLLGLNPATVALVVGVVTFAIVRAADEIYFSQVNVEPYEVGRDYSATIGAAVGFATLVVCTVAVPVGLFVRFKQRRVERSLALVGAVVGALVSAWILISSFAFSFAGPCGTAPRINAFRNDPSPIDELTRTDGSSGPDRLTATTDLKLIGVGSAHSIVVDCNADSLVAARLPVGDFVIYTADK